MKQYLEGQRGWLEVETPPGYSPDLNRVEDLWGSIKGQDLANRCACALGEAEEGVCGGMARVRQSMQPFSFLHHAGLFLDPSCHSIMRESVNIACHAGFARLQSSVLPVPWRCYGPWECSSCFEAKPKE